MRAMVTAGGTKVPLDDVRYIGNTATGGLGAKIVVSLLLRNCESGRLTDPVFHIKDRAAAGLPASWGTAAGYRVRDYWSFEDYSNVVRTVLQTQEIDIVFLAAAVSDYGMPKQEGKISSDGGLILHLTPLPKIIHLVREWAGSRKQLVQVGFKLTSGLTPPETVEIAKVSGGKAGSDFTIANDKANLHVKHLVNHRTGEVTEMQVQSQEDVNQMVNHILKETKCV